MRLLGFEITIKRIFKPQPAGPLLFMETYGGLPYSIVTDKNMYDRGYIRSGWQNGIKRWKLRDKYEHDRILAEVTKERVTWKRSY